MSHNMCYITFPTLAILSFLFSLATYFLPPRVHPGTRARVENLEELLDIIPEIVEHIKNLRRVVTHEKRRKRKLQSDLRNRVPMVGILGGSGSLLDDDDALETASATELPPSPEHEPSSMNGTADILPQLVLHVGNEENGFSLRLQPVFIYEHIGTPSSIGYQPTLTINYRPIVIHDYPPASSTHDEFAERVTARAGDIRPRPRLSMPELNEAIGDWGNVVNTPEGPVLRIHGEEGHEFHIRQRADSRQNGEHRTNRYATATQIIHPSTYTARVVESTTPDSSTRSSRSASLSGTTLVDSVASFSIDDDDNDAVVPNGDIDGAPLGNDEIYRNNAYETPAANVRRRRAVSNIRRTARQNAHAERDNAMMNEEDGNVDVAEAEDVWWGLRHRRRDSMEVEMMQHMLSRERAIQAEQTHRVETNGGKRDGGNESSDGLLGEARRPASG
ncbi:hypothetical protein B0T12DRAFT_473262 [Alternaria alternata]|nr:hypothetical protein B0T12DRAFT_473262 [Alternaria alternata]